MARDAGLRLTPVRRRALEILLEAHRALGAYDVLSRLAEDGFGKQPPVAYRALDFLVENGFAHKIQRLNAYTACSHPGMSHAPAFFICDSCEAVAEATVPEVKQAISGVAKEFGFEPKRVTVETVGICPSCTSTA